MTKVFVYQDWPSRFEVEWTDRFANALREAGFEVTQEWTLPKPLPQDDVERALRESDAIVFLLLNSTSLQSQSLFFNYGVASFGGKGIVTVASRSINVDLIPIRELRDRVVTKSTAQRTALNVAQRLQELSRKNVA